MADERKAKAVNKVQCYSCGTVHPGFPDNSPSVYTLAGVEGTSFIPRCTACNTYDFINRWAAFGFDDPKMLVKEHKTKPCGSCGHRMEDVVLAICRYCGANEGLPKEAVSLVCLCGVPMATTLEYENPIPALGHHRKTLKPIWCKACERVYYHSIEIKKLKRLPLRCDCNSHRGALV